eukprot:5025270-Alexandrium_andersonii.AAC.1
MCIRDSAAPLAPFDPAARAGFLLEPRLSCWQLACSLALAAPRARAPPMHLHPAAFVQRSSRRCTVSNEGGNKEW